MVDGAVRKFDDRPARDHGDANDSEPAYDRQPGDAPAPAPDEIDAFVAFLRTLSDGWQP
ncbi:MAG: hypothetical protein ACK5TK_16660 [Betaproteobacteria bacterium]